MTSPIPNPTPGRRLDGVVCVITGAARGIGLAIAERLGAEGGRLACLDISQRRLAPAVQALGEAGLQARGYPADVGLRADVSRVFAAIEADFGAPIGVLVNNAVWVRFQALDQIDEADLDRMLAVGLKGLVWTLQAAAPQMQRRGGGSVINLSSVGAHYPQAGSMAYAALKAGVVGLTRAAAVELSPSRIRVNAVLPGMVGTAASLAQFDAATLAAREAAMPLGRFGREHDIAAAVAYLASDDASYVQGSSLVVDGGWTVGRH